MAVVGMSYNLTFDNKEEEFDKIFESKDKNNL